MASKGLADGDVLDLERGVIAGEDDGPGAKSAKSLVNRVCCGSSGTEEPIDGATERGESPLAEKKFGGEEETLGLVEKKTEAEKPKKKKAGKKPPKPPRPPRAASLDAADQKLIQQISELATLKRARTERMKALMKMKNSKPASSSSNFWALVITVLFCLVIVWQGIPETSSSSSSFLACLAQFLKLDQTRDPLQLIPYFFDTNRSV